MNKKIALGLSTLLILGLMLAAIAYAATTTHGPVTVATADSYVSTGDNISGWDWLRDSSYSANSVFTFNNVPRTTKDGKIYLRFAFLVTNGVNGGSGYSTNIKVRFVNAVHPVSKVVRLENLTPIKDPNFTVDGFGYMTNGKLAIKARQVPASGTLIIKVTRIKGLKPHVATQVGDGANSGLMLMWH